MKKILLLILFLISSNVLAEWVFLGTNTDNSNFYIDPQTIEKEGNKVRFWEKVNLGKADDDVKSIRGYREIDCKKKTYTVLSATFFSESDFQGNMELMNIDSKIIYIAPNTADEEVMNYVCK